MRIGLVTFHSVVAGNTLRGTFISLSYIKQHFIDRGFEVDTVLVSEDKNYYQPDMIRIDYHCRTVEDILKIKDYYDFIVFQTPGISTEKYDPENPKGYTKYIDAFNNDFAIIYHSEEYDGNPPHQPYKYQFINHKNCCLLIYCAPGYEKLYQRDTDKVQKYVIATICPPLKSKKYVLNKCRERLLHNKKYQVVQMAAWTTFKKQVEYFQLAKDFNDNGIINSIYGNLSSTFYAYNIAASEIDEITMIKSDDPGYDIDKACKMYNHMLALARPTKKSKSRNNFPSYKNKEDTPRILCARYDLYNGGHIYDYGGYTPEDVQSILKDKTFLWAPVYYKKGGKAWCPRLETAVFEAINEGTLPVLCDETSPDYVLNNDTALIVTKKLDNQREMIKYMANMSHDEIISRVSKLYDQVERIVHKKMWNDVTDTIYDIILGNE